jgi:hypothetical protein
MNMKILTKTTFLWLSLIFGLGGYPLLGAEIWVSPTGSDQNTGSRVKPLQSIGFAQRKARELRRLNDPSVQGGIRIHLMDGTYFLDEPLLFRPEDSGTKENPTVLESAPGENPVVSGGIEVKGWIRQKEIVKGLPSVAKGKIWVADIPESGGRSLEFRQLWIDGKKAQRAGTFGDGPLPRILSVNKEKEEMWIPAPAEDLSGARQLELVIHQWWAIAILRVKNLSKIGDSALVTFHQPESRIEFEHPWPAPYIDIDRNKNGNSAFYLVNAIGLLNQPGEWYADPENGKVYYWPREGEDMTTAEAIVPHLETLVSITGSPDNPVSHIHFKGITFSHTTWLRPSRAGHVPLQAGIYLLDAYKLPVPGTKDNAGLENQWWGGRQAAGVTMTGANHILFNRCRFANMAATGLDFISATCHNTVQGCLFRDIGGTAVQIGFFGDAGFEGHLPYDPADRRWVCQSELISDNLITDCTNEDWGCVGISVGYASKITIQHNEVSDVHYSGICVGWGWTKTVNCMRNNRVFANHIHHFAKNMYDMGGIYTLSAQPGTEIYNNSIHDLMKAPYAHDPDHCQYIYFDEGSSYMYVHDNWTEQEKFFTNNNGPGNRWENNGPQVSSSIRENAGIRPEFRIE